ncbi:MAG: formylglycine-generating enzyme family protein [Chitinophagia bacterium]|nr:formylglycine-generating enzyme family protein [Chitinophagia bacterium]
MKYIIFSLLVASAPFLAIAKDKNNKPNDNMHPEMVAVKGGQFDMGSNDESEDRKPAHSVTLADFSIGKYEVTEAEYKAVMGADAITFPYCSDCPVTNISWNDAMTYIQKLNAATGHHYRLPTEAEWEYAARGGATTKHKKYAGRRVLQYIAWFERNANDHVHVVGKKDPNELGLYDMTGNVEEWCNDWYGKNYFTSKDVTNPTGPESGISKVVRGGSWKSEKGELSVTRRAAYLPKDHSIALGFRLAE